MADRDARKPTDENPEHFKGWKEIAGFLRVHPRTVQRWLHRGVGVPVHRIDTGKSSVVFATRRDLEAWMCSAEGHAAREGNEAAEDREPCEREPDDAHATAGSSDGAAGAVGDLPAIMATELGAVVQEPTPRADATSAGPTTQPKRSRALSRTAAGAVVIACVATVALVLVLPRLRTPQDSADPEIRPGRTVPLVVTFADGTTGRFGVSLGRPSTMVVSGHVLTLSLEGTNNGALILQLCDAAQSDRSSNVAVLATLKLRRGETALLAPSSRIAAITWPAAGRVQGGNLPPAH
jgi:hypothetical protein